MNDEKSVSMFYQNVKEKQEPFVCSSWVLKINHKGQKDQRFFVATYVQFYLCKKSVFSGSISISREYPWAKLKSISSPQNTQLCFEFQDNKVTIETKKVDIISAELSNLFFQMFPPEFNAKLSFPIERIAPNSKTNKSLFQYLFLSFCKANGCSISDTFFKKLSKSLKNNPDLLNLTEFPLDKKLAKSIFSALNVTQQIKRVVVQETKYFALFDTLANLVSHNKQLEGFEIVDVKKGTDFELFMDSLTGSSVVSLKFSKFHFTQQNFGYLIYCNQSQHIEELEFSECDLDEKKMSFFLKLSDRFENLHTFALNHDFNTITQSILRNVKRFFMNSCITTVEFRNANINIKDFFTAINGGEAPLQSIDLSLNIFTSLTDPVTKTIPESFVFPPTLKKLNLSKVKWETDSLIYMLTEQQFISQCTVDYSNLTLFNDDWDHFYTLLDKATEPLKPPISIKYKHNMIDPRFIMFLTKMHPLIRLNLSGCYYDSDKMVSILNSLVVLVQTLSLRKFSMAGSKKCVHAPVICELLPVMTSTNTIIKLDISNNAIGNQGIEILQRFVEQNDQLESLEFDGCYPTQLQPYISLLKSLCQSQSLTTCHNPREDLQRLVQMFPNSKELIQTVWQAVTDHLNDNRDDINKFAESMLFTSLVNFEVPKAKEEELTVDWNMEFNFPMNTGDKEWEAMEKKYNCQNLTSICVN